MLKAIKCVRLYPLPAEQLEFYNVSKADTLLEIIQGPLRKIIDDIESIWGVEFLEAKETDRHGRPVGEFKNLSGIFFIAAEKYDFAEARIKFPEELSDIETLEEKGCISIIKARSRYLDENFLLGLTERDVVLDKNFNQIWPVPHAAPNIPPQIDVKRSISRPPALNT